MRNLGVAKLKLGTIILPRSDSPEVISRLAEFGWFHKIDSGNETVTPEIDDLLLRAQKLHQRADDVISGLGIPLRVGILEIMFKGTVIKMKNYSTDEIETIIKDLEENMGNLMDDGKIMTKTESGIVSELDKILDGAKSSLGNSKDSMQAEYDAIIDNGKKEAEKIEKQIIGSSNLEARNKQITLVEDAILSVFEQALDKLRSSKTEPAFLKLLVKQAIDTLGTTKVIISTNSNDADSVKSALVDFTESQLDSKPIECLGGIIAKSSDGTMTFDNTIDARFNRMKPLIRKYVASKFGLE